ncbi:MAG TPA: nuclear transport factor 2 family protein [Rhizomicrobium sp.]|jgi:hypothetical protein|nr:nuclear transport factor 2 family protein [Rhizomicrobium sp.]
MELTEIAKGYYRAYETNDRSFVENNLAPGFTFTSPFDDHIDRDAYFARCWPKAHIHKAFHFAVLVQSGDQVMIVYDGEHFEPSAVHPSARWRNAELMTFEKGKLKSVEVFFGDPPSGLTRREFAVQCGAG